MDSATVFRRLRDAGIRLEVQGDRLSASPSARLNTELRSLICAHKPALVTFLIDAQMNTERLVEAAMRACDHHGDGSAARDQMRRECLDTPAHLRGDLCDHFNQQYRNKS